MFYVDPARGDRIQAEVIDGEILLSVGGNDIWLTADQADELDDILRTLIADARNGVTE